MFNKGPVLSFAVKLAKAQAKNKIEQALKDQVRAIEEANVVYNKAQKVFTLVDKIMAIEELFRLSMSEGHSQLTNFLSQYPEYHQEISEISTAMHLILSATENLAVSKPKNELEIFLIAFNKMMETNGFSMAMFLKSNGKMHNFFRENIEQLTNLYEAFKKYKNPPGISP